MHAFVFALVAMFFTTVLLAAVDVSAAEDASAALYLKYCSSCHGDDGKGPRARQFGFEGPGSRSDDAGEKQQGRLSAAARHVGDRRHEESPRPRRSGDASVGRSL
jgi:mono/diheme cytochrome c family protein